jgi:early secretory antigenic target protein ESAT-6
MGDKHKHDGGHGSYAGRGTASAMPAGGYGDHRPLERPGGGGINYGGGGPVGAGGGAASGAILVTFERIGDAATTCNNMVATMEREFDELQRALNLMRDKWSGDARDRYEELQRRWDMSHDNLKQILLQIARALLQAQQNYLSTEQANANIGAG